MGFLSLSSLRVTSCMSRTCYQPLAGSRSGPKLIGMVRRIAGFSPLSHEASSPDVSSRRENGRVPAAALLRALASDRIRTTVV
jgi:hypothetical protein